MVGGGAAGPYKTADAGNVDVGAQRTGHEGVGGTHGAAGQEQGCVVQCKRCGAKFDATVFAHELLQDMPGAQDEAARDVSVGSDLGARRGGAGVREETGEGGGG